MAAETGETFGDRFMRFYDECTDDEQLFLSWLFSFSPGAPTGDEADVEGFSGNLLDATKQMQETQMSFNLLYLQLQSQMQHENRSYNIVTNVMRTKHDTVNDSISKVR